MRQHNEDTLTDAVLARLGKTADPRLREIMTSLVKHLHAFVRDSTAGVSHALRPCKRTPSAAAVVDRIRALAPGHVVQRRPRMGGQSRPCLSARCVGVIQRRGTTPMAVDRQGLVVAA